jgi:hypothetical protein
MCRIGGNMKKLIGFFAIFLITFIAMSNFMAVPCQAASAEVELSVDSTEITVGDDIYVYLEINSNTMFGNFEANLSYDDNILEYKEETPAITGGNGFLKISDMNVTQGSKSRKYAIKFTALKVGNCEISFSGRAMVYDFDSDMEMSVSSNVLNLSVKAKNTASTNTYLKSLKTNPVDITPEFDKNNFEYNVSVDNTTEKLIITAVPEDEKANVSISGNESLQEGENKVIVTVLAESGDIIKYTINVYREASDKGEEATGEAMLTPGAAQNDFELVQFDGEDYVVLRGRYKLVEPDETVAIPEGYTETELYISGKFMQAYAPGGNLDSDFFLIYAMKDGGEAEFYQYDKVEKTLQRYISDNKDTADLAPDTEEDNSKVVDQYHTNLNNAAVAIAILSAVCVLLLFVTVRLLIKSKKRRRR